MSPTTISSFADHHCFPRVSGDEPMGKFDSFLKNLFSPRERG